jgi:hypothetical protein
MPIKEAAFADRTASIVPRIVCEHGDDVASVRAEDAYQLVVTFHDGTSGRVHMARLITSQDAGVFAALRDPARFAEVGVEFGAVTWPHGIDLAPDAMYEALHGHGQWVL